MSFEVQQEKFSGPLHLLLELIEKKEFSITEIALASVTEEYLQKLEREDIPAQELGDFLVVAARLLWMKSKALLPKNQIVDEEGPSLSSQLKMYQTFVEASKTIEVFYQSSSHCYTRFIVPTGVITRSFHAPPASLTLETLHQIFEHILKRLRPLFVLQTASLSLSISIEERILQMKKFIQEKIFISFRSFFPASGTPRREVIISFLALLELARQQVIELSQAILFEDITIKHIE